MLPTCRLDLLIEAVSCLIAEMRAAVAPANLDIHLTVPFAVGSDLVSTDQLPAKDVDVLLTSEDLESVATGCLWTITFQSSERREPTVAVRKWQSTT
jgi:hypothetical protein